MSGPGSEPVRSAYSRHVCFSRHRIVLLLSAPIRLGSRVSLLSERRAPSGLASHALDSFARLYAFFGRDAPLAGVLGWDEATVAGWRRREVVRPHMNKAAQVVLLLALCDEARPYMRDDLQVGRWMGTALPNLHGVSPAQWLAENGQRGLRELTHGLVAWKPRLPVS
jgi:hypothetical protein